MSNEKHQFQRLRDIMIYNKVKDETEGKERPSCKLYQSNPISSDEQLENTVTTCEENETTNEVDKNKVDETTSDTNMNYVDNKKYTVNSVATQTNKLESNNEILSLVKIRMDQFQKASMDDKVMDKKLSPMLRKLQEEHKDLQAKAAMLQAKLDSYEITSAKRRKLACSNELHTSSPSAINNIPNSRNNTNNISNYKNVRNLPPFNGLQSSVNTSRRPPIQMVPPVQQVPKQPHLRNFQNNGFVVLGSNTSNNFHNINTQVVASNQGLRMTNSQSNDIMIRTPYNGEFPKTITNMGNNGVSVNNSGSVAWQLQQQQQQQQYMRMQVMPARIPVPVNQQIVQIQPTQVSTNEIVDIATKPSHLPQLKASISTSGNGIILTWDYETSDNPEKYKVQYYQLFANQSKDGRIKVPNDASQWKKIGVVNALPLPMACTLTQIASGNIYHFTVVAVDAAGLEGNRSNPCTIRLNVGP